MSKEELYDRVKDLLTLDTELYLLEKEYKIGNYNYEIVGNNIILTIEKHDDIRIFRRLLKDGVTTPRYDNIGLETALQLFFNHYKYGHTNGSNVLLVNENDDVLAIQWNNCTHTSRIIVYGIPLQNCIIINNIKKLEYNFKSSELNKYKDWLSKLKI